MALFLESEEQMNTLLDASPDLIIFKDGEGCWMEANKEAISLFQLEGIEYIVSMEALIRWNHPEMGLVPPAEFIPLAEETGLIVTIGEWVLETVCRQNRSWQGAGLKPMKIAVNLYPRQLQDKHLLRTIARILRENWIRSILSGVGDYRRNWHTLH